MRAHKLGRRVGQLVAVAVFGVSATLGGFVISTAAQADETQGSSTVDEATDATSPDDFQWD